MVDPFFEALSPPLSQQSMRFREHMKELVISFPQSLGGKTALMNSVSISYVRGVFTRRGFLPRFLHE
jgi:hypothetical protein